jgi:hypothetical protein
MQFTEAMNFFDKETNSKEPDVMRMQKNPPTPGNSGDQC